MCFYNDDYDWVASVQERSTIKATKRVHCIECSKLIMAGEECERIWQQEHEECQVCCEYGDDYDEDNPQDSTECDHDYGETFEGFTCQHCLSIIEAIRQVEVEEGCPEHAQRPSIGGLYEEAFSRWNDDARKYASKVAEMFPELRNDLRISNVLERDDAD
jgi:hypothetical protein